LKGLAVCGAFLFLEKSSASLNLLRLNHDKLMKSTAVTYLLWLFFGLHYIYLGKIGTQFLYWITAGGLGIWAFIDLFRIPGMVERKNNEIYISVQRRTGF
jgi:TM2 domain-containing membrane protein YozV